MATLYQDRQTVAPNLDRVGQNVGGHDSVYQATTKPVSAYAVGGRGNARTNATYANAPTEFFNPGVVNTAGETTKALARGTDILQAAGYGAVGVLGNILGSETLSNFGLEGYQENMTDVQWNQSAVPTIADINDAGDFLTWAYSSTVEQVPMIAASLLTGGVGAAIGTRAATQAGKSALTSKAFQQFAKTRLAKDQTFDMLEDQAKVQLTNQFVQQAGAKAAQGYAFTQNAVIESGLNWGEVAQELGSTSSNPYSAISFGVIGGLADMFGIEGNLLRRLTKQPVSDFADKQFKKAGTSWLKRRAVNTVLGAGSEGITEGVQELMNILNTTMQVDGKVFLSEDTADQILNALAAGAVGGAAFSALTPSGASKPETPQSTTATGPGTQSNESQLALYDDRERESMERQATDKNRTIEQVTNLRIQRKELAQAQTQLKDTDPKKYKEATDSIKIIDKQIAETLAYQATLDEAAKNERKAIQAQRNKTLAGLNKEQQEKDYKEIQKSNQPVLSRPETQAQLSTTIAEVDEFSKAAAKNLRKRIQNLDSDIKAATQGGADNAKAKSLRKEKDNSIKLLNKLQKDTKNLKGYLGNIMTDSELGYVENNVDTFYDTYASSRPEMQVSAVEARVQANQDANAEANKKLDEQIKALRNAQSLINKDPNLPDLAKSQLSAQYEVEIQKVEAQRNAMNAANNGVDIANTLDAEAQQQQQQTANVAQKDQQGVQEDLGNAVQAVQPGIEQAQQQAAENTKNSIKPKVRKSKKQQPTTQQDLEQEADNATTNINNVEVEQSIEEQSSNAVTTELQNELDKLPPEKIIADKELSTIVTDDGNVTTSPALVQIASHMQGYFDNMDNGTTDEQKAQAVQELSKLQYANEVREATAASNLLSKAEETPMHISKALSKLPVQVQALVTYVPSSSSLNVPVEVQNIVASSDNVLSVYHNGRIYLFETPLNTIAAKTNTSITKLINLEVFKTLSKSVGAEYAMSVADLTTLKKSIRLTFPQYTESNLSPFEFLSMVMLSNNSTVTTEQKVNALKFLDKYVGKVLKSSGVKVTDQTTRALVDGVVQYYGDMNNQNRVDRTYYSTVNNSTLDTSKVTPYWGALFGSLDDVANFLSRYAMWYKTERESLILIEESNNLRSQPDNVKDIFMHKWKPADMSVVENEDGTFSVRIAKKQGDLSAILVNKDSKGKLFKTKEAALNSIKDSSALLDVPMEALLDLYGKEFPSPKEFSRALNNMGITGINTKVGSTVVFRGDDVGITKVYPNVDVYNSPLEPEYSNPEQVVAGTELTTDDMEVTPIVTKERQQQYLANQTKNRLEKMDEKTRLAYDTIEKFLRKFPFLRSKVLVVLNSNDARVRKAIRTDFAKPTNVIPGVYDPSSDKVILNLEQIVKGAELGLRPGGIEAMATETLIHEAIVHLGLRYLFESKEYTAFMHAIKHAVAKSMPGDKLHTLWNDFKRDTKNAYMKNEETVIYEEFLAYIAENMTLEEIEKTPTVKRFFSELVRRVKSIYKQIVNSKDGGFSADDTLTVEDLYNTVRASAARLKEMSPDVVGKYTDNKGKMYVITEKPKASNYLEGAEFSGRSAVSNCIAYSTDVMNSQQFAFGLPLTQLQDKSVVFLTDTVESIPELADLATEAQVQPTATLKHLIDKLHTLKIPGVDITEQLRKANVKIVIKSKDEAISLYNDMSTVFPRNGSENSLMSYNRREAGYDQYGFSRENTVSGRLFNSITLNKELINDPTPTSPSVTTYANDLNMLQRAKDSEYAKMAKEKTRKYNPDGSLNLGSAIAKLKENFLDRYNPVKMVEQFLQKAYGKAIDLTGTNSLHNLLSTSSNKVNAGKAYYDTYFINRIFGELAKIKIPGTFKDKDAHDKKVIDLLDTYLYASHAEERNRSLLTRSKGALGVAASGMSNERALEILAEYSGDQWKSLRDAARLVQNLNRDVLNKYHDAGMITDVMYNNITNAYKNYVPLMSDETVEKLAPEFSKNQGSSLSVNKKKIVSWAQGRKGEQVSPVFAQSILKAYASVDIIERNNLSRKLAGIVQETTAVEKQLKKNKQLKPGTSASAIWEMSPSKDSKGKSYKGDTPSGGFTFDEEGNLKLPNKKHKFEGDGYDLITFLDTKGEEQIIAIKDPHLGRSLKGANVAVPGTILKYMGKATRQLARLMTGRNPIFILVNPLRDIQQSLMTVSSALQGQELEGIFGASTPEEVSTTVKRIRTNMMNTYRKPSNMKMLYDYFRASSQDAVAGNNLSLAEFDKKYANDPESAERYDDFIDFLDLGGKTTVGDYLTLEDTYIDLRKKVRKAREGENYFQQAIGYIDTLSETSEASVRFATYAAFLQEARRNINSRKDLSLDQKRALIMEAKELSARMALDSTVNFSRRGAKAGPMNAMYAFSSAALQGGQRVINHLWRDGAPRGDNVRRVSTYLASFSLAGLVMSQVASALMGDDEDGLPLYYKIPEHERMNNLILPAPFFDGGYIKIPLPYGFSSLWSVGTVLHSTLAGFQTPSQGSVSLLNSMYSSILPWDLPSEGFGTLVPTIARPVYQVSVNKTFTGTAIRPESTFMDTPDSQKAWRTTPEFYKSIATFLNSMSGGNEVESGFIDISPESIEHIAQSYGSGLYRLLADSVSLGNSLVFDKYNPNPKIPVFGGVAGVVGDSGTQSIYYELSDRITKAKTMYKNADESPDLSAMDKRTIKQEYSDYHGLAKAFDSTEKKIKKLRTELNSTKSSSKKDLYQKQINSLQKQFLKVADRKGLAPYDPLVPSLR